MTRRLIIGSTAMRRYIPEMRQPKDVDVFSPDAPGDDSFWHPSFEDWIPPGANDYATIDELYTIKVSHSYWELKNGSWGKHMADIVALKNAGAVMLQSRHDLLRGVWADRYGKKRTDLSMDKAAFFADAVVRKYDHDSIHASVAYGDHPLYEDVMKDGASVQTDMAKVKALPFDQQVRLFREEIYATALERKCIPTDYRHSPRGAYAWALRRTITSLTKGWSAQFLVENYETFRSPDVDYVARHRANAHKLIALEG